MIKRIDLNKKLKAFTLTELLVVLVIVGILVLLALPNLMPLISKAKATEAQLQLEALYNAEKMYFYTHSKYTDDITQLDFEQVKLTTEDGTANYLMDIKEATATTFVATAESVVDFDGDGEMNLWQMDQDKKLIEVVKD
ncbi:MAG: prepilin-type N-terminal cleavage/methylation domain-containing protein [Flavobacteriales bacterium]|nr:prepilin-type N-terminal cleavage/methylation domain-containing protein [Flavobacteriales bacterium]